MEVKKLKEDGNMILVELKGDTIGFANLIREELWNDNDVDEAASIKEHPYMAEPKIYVKMKGKAKPEKALSEAAKRIQSSVKELRKAFGSAKK